MIIRLATTNDLPQILSIYASARKFMAENGNPDQWVSGYPSEELLLSHIGTKLYVADDNGSVACVFYFAIEHDPTYDIIYNGEWKSDLPYGVVHRIASSRTVKGAARFCLDWAYSQCKNLRIDTHEKNIPMQNLLRSLDFQYCGIIHIANGDERLAFQKCKESDE